MQNLIKERILVLDGAMGTMIQQYNLTEADFRGERFQDIPGQLKGNNDLLCLTRPDVIEEIHRKYLEAGADIIETNTFNATSVSMADYHMQPYCREINLAAARLARKIADEYTARTPQKPRFVAGSVGPTNKTCSMSPDVNDPAFRALTFDVLEAAYIEQMEALLEGGVDAILIETIFDTLNAKAAIRAAELSMQKTGRKVPLMLSVTVSDVAGRTLSGQTGTVQGFQEAVDDHSLFAAGYYRGGVGNATCGKRVRVRGDRGGLGTGRYDDQKRSCTGGRGGYTDSIGERPFPGTSGCVVFSFAPGLPGVHDDDSGNDSLG